MSGRISALFGAQDMTQGSPVSNLIKFSVPLLIGNLAQQLYSTVDSIVVGQCVGDSALAAIGTSMPILNLLLVLFMGISVGASIMVSQYFGAGEKEKLSATIGTTITATFLSSLVIMIAGPFLSPSLLELVDTPADIFAQSSAYLTIVLVGILGSAYYNIISGVLRGLGDSITPLIFLIVACGLNVVLDIWFVAGLDMNVAGAAWATIISQAVSGALCLVRLLLMRDAVHVKLSMLWPKKIYVKQLVRLGVPSGLTQAIFSLAMFVVQRLTNGMGDDVITVNTIVMRVDGFAMMPNFTFGTAMTTYTGQNIGAGKLDRVEKGTKDGLKVGLVVSAILVALILFFGRYLMEMFTTTTAIVNLGMEMMGVLAVGYMAMAVTQILSGVMRGAGDTMTPMWISIITTVVIRVPIAYLLAYLLPRTPEYPDGSPYALFISLLASWVMGAVLTAIFYKAGRWKKKHSVAQEAEKAVH